MDTAAALGVEVPRFKKTTPVQTMVADLSYMLGMNEQVRALPEAQKANLRRFWDEVESAAGALRRAQSVPVKIGSAQGFRTGRPVKVEVYHGSDRPVTGFDPLKLGDNTGARSASMGFFFAGRQSTSQAYLRPNKESVTITPEKALAMPRARLGELIDGWQTQSMSGDFVYDWINEILVEELGARPIKNNPTEGGDGMPDRGSLTKWVKTAPKEAIRSLVTAINAYDQQYPLTEDPWSEDGGAEGMGSVSRYVVDLVNPYVHDYKGEGYRDVPYAEVIAKAKADGHDGVILMNTRDPGPEVDNIFVVFDPGQAQFDGVAFGDTLPSIDELPPENLKNLETWSGSKGIGPADEQVRVYRAVPKGSKQTAIQPGDWVSANRDYLTEYAGRDATVIEATIPANELVDAQTGAVARDTLIWTPSNASGAFEAATRDWPAALRDRTLEEGVAYQQTQVEGLFPDGERLLDEAADRLMDELNNPADLDGASDAFIARAEEAEFRDEIIAALRAAPYRPTGNPETLNAAAFVRRGTGAPVESLARQIERAGGARGFLSGNVLPSIDDPLAGEHGRKDGTPAERAAALKQATDAMNAPPLPPPTWAGPLFKDMGTFSKYAVHPRTIAAFDKAFTPIYRVAEAQIEARDRIASELATKAQAYFDLPKVGKARVHAVLELGRLKGEVLSGKKMSMTNEGEPAQLSSDGEMITLSDAEKTAYWGVRNMLNDALDRFRDQALTDFGIDPAEFQGKGVSKRLIEMADAIPTGFAGNARAQALRTAATIVDEIEQARRTGYVPFSRFGDIVVTVKDADNATIWASKVDSTGMLNTVRKKFGAAVVADIPAVRAEMDRLRDKFRGQDVTVGAFQAQSLAEGQSDVRMADIDMLAEVANVNNQQWDAIREQLERAVKAKGFRKHFFGASNTPGYSTDFERSLSDYMLGMAGYLARRQALPKWEAAIGAMPTQKANLIAYAKTYRDYVQNPTEEWQRLRQFGFLWYLAGVPATALVNLTQVDLLTAPYLMQFAGAARVQVELQKARLEAAGMVSLNAGMDVFSPEKAPADVRDDLQEAWDEGFFVPLNTYELMGTAYTGSRGQRTFDRAFRTVIDAVALTFTAAERHNRVATFIAAHRIARMPGIQEKVQAQLAANALARDTLGDWTPKGFAQWVIDETHFRMGKVNRPTITRGIGAPLLQFKGFTMQSLERWITMALLQGPQGKKAMLISLGVMWLMSGFWGLPGADDLRDLFEKMYKALAGKDFDTETKLREAVVELTGSPRIAQAFSKGSTFPMGLDLSGRMGMGNIAPDTPLAMLGIPGDLFIGRPTKFIERASQDNWSGAFAELAPNFIKNPMQAATWADRGVSTIRGRRVITPDQLDAVDIGMRAIGFQPSKVTNERERQFAERRAATSIDEMRRDYYTRVSQALADEDRAIRKGDAAAAKAAREKVQDAYSDIAKHNDSAEDSERIELNENTLRRRVAQDLNGPSAVRKQARGRAEEIREVYGRTR